MLNVHGKKKREKNHQASPTPSPQAHTRTKPMAHNCTHTRTRPEHSESRGEKWVLRADLNDTVEGECRKAESSRVDRLDGTGSTDRVRFEPQTSSTTRPKRLGLVSVSAPLAQRGQGLQWQRDSSSRSLACYIRCNYAQGPTLSPDIQPNIVCIFLRALPMKPGVCFPFIAADRCGGATPDGFTSSTWGSLFLSPSSDNKQERRATRAFAESYGGQLTEREVR